MGNLEDNRNEEMKRYLYCEMDETEQTSVEEKMIEDDEYFDDLETLENELIHQYARNELVGEEKTRFEKSLNRDINRKAKVANAMALQTYIEENKQLITPFLEEDEVGKSTFFSQLKDFFSFQRFSMQYALGSLALLLAVGLGFSVYRNYQANQEILGLKKESVEQTEKYNNLQIKENELQIRIDKIKQQGSELSKTNEELIKAKNEINEIRRQKETIAEEIRQTEERLKNLPKQPSLEQKTTFATAILSARGGNTETQPVNLKSTDAYVKVTLPVLGGGYQVEVNGKRIKSAKIKDDDILIIPRKYFKSKTTPLTITDSVGNPTGFKLLVNK